MSDVTHLTMPPSDPVENTLWRHTVAEHSERNRTIQQEIIAKCKEDPMYYANGFLWTFDPLRYPDGPIRPFIFYAFQEGPFKEILAAIGRYDLLIEKSRDMGATWLCLIALQWRWRFMRRQEFLLASRNESYVDEAGNSKTLFSKLDLMLSKQPQWMRPMFRRTAMRLENCENESRFNGESATGELARGGRWTAIMWDEVGAWQEADAYRALSSTMGSTSCRIFNSTPNRGGKAYADMAMKCQHKARLHWSQHPKKNQGLYTSIDAKLKILDEKYQFPPDYPFITDDRLRSPWYDGECVRTPVASIIRQELDIDYTGAGALFYDIDLLTRMLKTEARNPVVVGELSYNELGEPGDFMPNKANGQFNLWFLPVEGRKDGKAIPPEMECVLGIDIGVGTGASNSVLVAGDKRTGEKILEYATAYQRPEDFAVTAVAVARWLNNAFMVWEANGPGRPFGSRVVEMGYRNIYYRRSQQQDVWPQKTTGARIPGFHSTSISKRQLLTDYGLAMARGDFHNRSQIALEECRQMVYLSDRTIGHEKSHDSMDPSGAGENHSDRVIADALCCLGMKARPWVPDAPVIGEAPVNSFGWRRRIREQEATEKECSACVF